MQLLRYRPLGTGNIFCAWSVTPRVHFYLYSGSFKVESGRFEFSLHCPQRRELKNATSRISAARYGKHFLCLECHPWSPFLLIFGVVQNRKWPIRIFTSLSP